MSGSVPVVVLAGGQGSRIGGGKPLRRLGGERLIDRAIRLASLWSGDICVAAGMAQGFDDLPVGLLQDEPEMPGPIGGLAAALDHARGIGYESVLTIACDTPFLPADLLARLSSATGDSMAALAASGGRLHPACALWRSAAHHALPAYVATGRRSLQGFAEHVGFAIVEWAADPLDPFFNINDEAQLREAEALQRRADPRSR